MSARARHDRTPTDRGQIPPGPASIVLGFFLLIIIGAVVWSFLDPAVTTSINVANNTTTHSDFNTHMGYNEQIWNNVLVAILGMGLLGTLAMILAVTGGR